MTISEVDVCCSNCNKEVEAKIVSITYLLEDSFMTIEYECPECGHKGKVKQNV